MARRKSKKAIGPRGECYPWAYRYVLAHSRTAVLVHGYVLNWVFAKCGIEDHHAHAWVEDGGRILDWQTTERGHCPPSLSKYAFKSYPPRVFQRVFKPQYVVRYSAKEAIDQALLALHYGPWHNPWAM
jgi:hypothetical protein